MKRTIDQTSEITQKFGNILLFSTMHIQDTTFILAKSNFFFKNPSIKMKI